MAILYLCCCCYPALIRNHWSSHFMHRNACFDKAKQRTVNKSRRNIRNRVRGNLKYNIFRLWSWLLGTKNIFNLVFLCYVDKDEIFPSVIWGTSSSSQCKWYRKTKYCYYDCFPLYFNSNLPTVNVIPKINISRRKGMHSMCKTSVELYSFLHEQFKIK